MENDAEIGGKPLINLGKVVYFPKGARVTVKEKKGDALLTEQPVEGGALWIQGSEFKETAETVAAPEMSTEFTSDKKGAATVYKFETPSPVPLIIEETNDRTTLKLRFLSNTPRAFVFPQPQPIWGFDAVYEPGSPGHTTVTVNFAPAIKKEKPFSGLKIMVDPGHHPDPGALGPRGTEERALTLLLARQLAEELKTRGAEVTLSREDQPLELAQRQARFKSARPDMVISLHFNSVGDDEDPRSRWGTQNIFLYPHSQPLAKSIHRYVTPVVRGHDLSFVQRNLVVTRYPAVPVVLVESTHIIMPDEEKKLLTPEYRAELAKTIAEGISNFLLGEAEARR
jgi:N-acetylmuramoyl-L-alanine amidase